MASGYKVNGKDILLLAHPVGSLYWSKLPTDPSVLFGGTWKQIKDKFILAAGNTYSVYTEGGEASHTLTINETPYHTHTRGSMNITGQISMAYRGGGERNYCQGALYYDNTTHNVAIKSGGNDDWGRTIDLDASRAWTGTTSGVGSNQPHNNMPPYVAYYCWERTE